MLTAPRCATLKLWSRLHAIHFCHPTEYRPEKSISAAQLLMCALMVIATVALIVTGPDDGPVEQAASAASESLLSLTRILNQ
jgi:hypothetical protein